MRLKNFFLEWWISKRYLKPKGKEGFFSVITLVSFLGIASGVAVLVVVMSVMNGFRTELINKIVGLNGHILIHPLDNEGIKDVESINEIRSRVSFFLCLSNVESIKEKGCFIIQKYFRITEKKPVLSNFGNFLL